MKQILIVTVLVMALFVVAVGSAGAAPELQGGPVIHYVGFGESLYSIAAQYNVPVEVIMRANGLVNPDRIYAGQPLQIPTGGFAPPSGPNYAGCGSHHTVTAGETLTAIAYRYGVPLQVLLSQNQLYNQDMVYVGQQICVPSGSRYTPPSGYPNYQPAPSGGFYHKVARGETLSSIAQRYGVDYVSVMHANNLNNPGFIWVGQRLLIPGHNQAPAYPQPPAYHQPPPNPPPAVPPVKPYHDDVYDDFPHPPPPEPADAGEVPAAPDYQAEALSPDLPLASQPIEVVVNGGASWVGEAFPAFPDPNAITTLIVSTEDKTEARTVRLRSGDYEVKGELGLVPEFGIDKFRFAFKHIPPGSYDVWIDDPEMPSNKAPVQVEAGQRIEVEFHEGLGFSGPTYASPDGWVLADWSNPSKPGENIGAWSNILVQTPASGLWVMIESEGRGYQAKCFTGSKGPGTCDFAGLSAGMYRLWIDGTDLTIKTYLDGDAYATFTFGRQAVPGGEDLVGPVSYD